MTGGGRLFCVVARRIGDGMLAIVLATGWLSQTTAMEISGDAAFYRQGLMAQVAETRGMDLDGYAGGVALMPCGDLGREVWVRFPGGWAGPFLVVDCSQCDHYELNPARGRVVDLSWETWQAQGLPRRPVPVSVRFKAPVRQRRQAWR
jgi:hypothetical protein